MQGQEQISEFYLDHVRKHKDRSLIRAECPLSTDIGEFKAWAEVANEYDLCCYFSFIILYNAVIPEEQRHAVAEYLMRVNSREYPNDEHLWNNQSEPYFKMNFETGEVFSIWGFLPNPPKKYISEISLPETVGFCANAPAVSRCPLG